MSMNDALATGVEWAIPTSYARAATAGTTATKKSEARRRTTLPVSTGARCPAVGRTANASVMGPWSNARTRVARGTAVPRSLPLRNRSGGLDERARGRRPRPFVSGGFVRTTRDPDGGASRARRTGAHRAGDERSRVHAVRPGGHALPRNHLQARAAVRARHCDGTSIRHSGREGADRRASRLHLRGFRPDIPLRVPVRRVALSRSGGPQQPL